MMRHRLNNLHMLQTLHTLQLVCAPHVLHMPPSPFMFEKVLHPLLIHPWTSHTSLLFAFRPQMMLVDCDVAQLYLDARGVHNPLALHFLVKAVGW